jgi:hypothetical protein
MVGIHRYYIYKRNSRKKGIQIHIIFTRKITNRDATSTRHESFDSRTDPLKRRARVQGKGEKKEKKRKKDGRGRVQGLRKGEKEGHKEKRECNKYETEGTRDKKKRKKQRGRGWQSSAVLKSSLIIHTFTYSHIQFSSVQFRVSSNQIRQLRSTKV